MASTTVRNRFFNNNKNKDPANDGNVADEKKGSIVMTMSEKAPGAAAAQQAGASHHQFLSDFFRTDIMNHCEFLKRLNNLRSDDCYLVAELCQRLTNQTDGKVAAAIEPFYGSGDDAVRASDLGHIARNDFSRHKPFPRNCFNIMMVYAALMQLDGHEYNIYELAYLNYHSKFPFRMAIGIFAIQVALLFIVVHSNLSELNVALHQRDNLIIMVDVCTTIFVIVFCYGQWTSARTFTTAVRGVIGSYLIKDEDKVIHIPNPFERGKWQSELMLFFNSFINQYALIFTPAFNILFILLSASPMDAILNGFALLFIFELDDYVLPLFQGVDMEDKLVINAHDFIMVPPKNEDLSCTRVGPDIALDAKLYVSLQQGDSGRINIYSRLSATKYSKTTYIFKGPQSAAFLSLCEESLSCLQDYKDIHD